MLTDMKYDFGDNPESIKVVSCCLVESTLITSMLHQCSFSDFRFDTEGAEVTESTWYKRFRCILIHETG